MTEFFAGRGFGPGLPATGAPVRARLVGGQLEIADWPGVSTVARTALSVRRQGHGVNLEWEERDGRCALSVSGPAASMLAREFAARAQPADRATRNWLRGALFLALGLPLLLLALFFGFRHQLVDAAVARISIEHEQMLAEQAWKAHSAQLRLIETGALKQRVDDIGARLVAGAPVRYAYRFHVADDPAVNAFALPAGYVVVNRGLIERARNAEEVAAVLAHEIEHVEQRHGLRGIVQAVGLSVLWMAVVGDAAGLAGDWFKDLAGLDFSREQELAADAGGYQRLLAAQVDPRGMLSFFEGLAEQEGAAAGTLALFSTHPASAERAEVLRRKLEGAPRFEPLPWAAVAGH